jgi:hypothetical protein
VSLIERELLKYACIPSEQSDTVEMTSLVVTNPRDRFTKNVHTTMRSLQLSTFASALLFVTQQSNAFQIPSLGAMGTTRHQSSSHFSTAATRNTSLMSRRRDSSSSSSDWSERAVGAMAAATFSLFLIVAPVPAFADGQTKDFKFPPIDFSDTTRCRLNSSSMGQANAARDKLYDLRQCELSGVDASGFDLSGVST